MCDTRPNTPCFLRPNSPTSSVSESFISLSGKHTEPRKYNEFATSFICAEPPVPNTLCLESSDSESEEFSRIPFKNPVPIVQGQVDPRLTKRDKAGTVSIRSKHLIPETAIVLQKILHPPLIQSREARGNYVYFRAKQWCEVNKALVVDQKYPKPDPNHVRKQHSDVHQEASKLTREVLQAEESKSNLEAPNVDENQQPYTLKSASFEDSLKEIFADIKPIPELITREEPWQFKALKTAEVRTKQNLKSTKQYWKRNIYPPKTRDEIIQDRRSHLPPRKPDHLETDYLSGIWEPEIMINEFQITGFGYDSRLLDGDSDKPVTNIDWYELQEIRAKCNEWLDQCKEFL